MSTCDNMIKRKDKDGTEYLFVWEAMRKAFDERVKEKGQTGKAMEELAKEINISVETMKGHLINRGASKASNPRIGDIKKYGMILKGDEYAFLVRLDTKEKSAEKQSKRRRSDDVQTIFDMLYNILSCYKASDRFNYTPCTDDSDGAWSYFEREVDKVRKALEMKFLGRRDSTDFQKLERIINETEVFIKSYSIPGVVKRWIEINPQILFFDCVFEIIEECGMETAIRLYRKGVIDYLPCDCIIEARNNYFVEKVLENDSGNLRYSDERIFQNELRRTLALVFGNDFKDNYAEKRVT